MDYTIIITPENDEIQNHPAEVYKTKTAGWDSYYDQCEVLTLILFDGIYNGGLVREMFPSRTHIQYLAPGTALP